MDGSYECQIAVSCEDCGEGNVDFFCSCCKRICENCLGKHIKSNPSHFASSYNGGAVHAEIVCEKHIGEICRLFCKKCCEPVCTVCSKIEHEGHKFSFLKDHLSSQRTLMEKELQRIDIEFKSTYVKLASYNEHKFSDIPAKYSAIREDVYQAGMALQKKTEETVKKVNRQIEAMEMEHLDCLKENKRKLQKVIENIEETKSEMFRQMSDPKCLATYNVVAYPFEQCPELMERILPVFKRSENEFACLDFLGTLTPSRKTTISKFQEKKPDTEDDNETKKSFAMLENANQIHKIDTVYGYIFDIMSTMNNTILACGTYKIKNSFTIRALDFSGKEVRLIPVQNQPKYLSQANDETIFYTSDSKQGIHMIKNDTTEKIALDVSWTPKGLACRSSGDIIVAEEHSEVKDMGRLSIYSPEGEMKQVYGTKNGLKKPSYVCENINFDICTTDEGRREVFIFFSTGDLKNVYKGKSDVAEFTSFTPRGLATDCMGNILIADYLHHAIHMLDSKGCFLRYILKNISFPTALSIDDKHRLLVGQYTEGSIQIVEYLKTYQEKDASEEIK